jgi:hypothetical protein
MTLSVMTFSITILRIMTHSITLKNPRLSMMAVRVTSLRITIDRQN